MTINLLESLGAADEASLDRVTIYVPSRDVEDREVDFEQWAAKAVTLLSGIGGGATRMPPSKGAWLRGDGYLIEEDVTLVYSFVDGDLFIQNIEKVRTFLHSMGRELNQGEIVIEVVGRLYKIRDFDEENGDGKA